MKVKQFIKKLEKYDPEAEVVTHDSENDFYSAALIWGKTSNDWVSWVSVKGKKRPDKMILIG